MFANGNIARSTEVSDADGSAGQPLATLTTRASEISADPQVIALVKDGQRLPPTPENLAWFHALMRSQQAARSHACSTARLLTMPI